MMFLARPPEMRPTLTVVNGGVERAGDEGLGVAGAAAVELAVFFGEREGLRPGAVVGDAVGVADKREGGFAAAAAGDQVGLFGAGVVGVAQALGGKAGAGQ